MFRFLFLLSFASIVGMFMACIFTNFKDITAIIALITSAISTITLYKLISIEETVQDNEKKITKILKNKDNQI